MIDIFTDQQYSNRYNQFGGAPRPQPSDFALHYFKDKKNGFFVDVGAFDGVTWSNSLTFELNFGWDGICVEPHPRAFKELSEQRKCKCLNYAVSDKNGEFDFLIVEGESEMLSGLVDTYDPRHKNRLEEETNKFNDNIVIKKIPCKTITNLMQEMGKTHIDYLSIDTEGSELKVMDGIDFNLITVNLISMECNFEIEPITKYMSEKGYKFIQKICADVFYSKK